MSYRRPQINKSVALRNDSGGTMLPGPVEILVDRAGRRRWLPRLAEGAVSD
ncbi:MAG: hypothetical protein R3A47_11150 [Polyangiales bacterium]